MDERRMIEPRLDERPRVTARWGRRAGPLLGAVLAVMLLSALVLGEVFGGASEAQAQQRAVPPGCSRPCRAG
jgi:hypothetical protein